MFINGTHYYFKALCILSITLVMTVFGTLSSQATPASLANIGSAQNTNGSNLFLRGKAYHDGNGVPVDLAKALSFYERAASLGSIDAKINLGYLYFVGQGVEQNFSKAGKYYLQAANAGDTAAQKNLGAMYEHGLGVTANMKTAQYWNTKKDLPTRQNKKVSVAPKKTKQLSTSTLVIKNMVAAGKPAKLKPVQTPVLISKPVKAALSVQNIPNVRQILSTTSRPKNYMLPNRASLQQRPQAFTAPIWAGSGIGLALMFLAGAATMWFAGQHSAIKSIKADRRFATEFFEHNRENLRTRYLRLPSSQRRYHHIREPWAVSLCASMVKFAMERTEDPNTKCSTSANIVKSLRRSPYEARQKIFHFIPFVQERIFEDLEGGSSKPLFPAKSFKYDQTSFFSSKRKRAQQSRPSVDVQAAQ